MIIKQDIRIYIVYTILQWFEQYLTIRYRVKITDRQKQIKTNIESTQSWAFGREVKKGKNRRPSSENLEEDSQEDQKHPELGV